MKNIRILFLTCISLITISCLSKNKEERKLVIESETVQNLQKYETAYFASGCFWCVEAIFESVKGVKEVVSGYSGGTEKNPTYQQVGSGNSTHAEAVEVYYNPKEISYFKLVQVFFGSHDPTTLNRQGPDSGTQYRSIAFYKNKDEKNSIEKYITALKESKLYNRPIVTKVIAFTKFYEAENYHQNYERLHPNNSYIRNVSIPRLNRFKENFPEYLKNSKH
ncbi:MAG: peptide-methionine (S)-S-oxide reductase MsrA [Cellulophaga sp.]